MINPHAKPHPAERSRMTPIQREIVDRLVARGRWHFGMIYYRSAYLRPVVKTKYPDGSIHYVDSWRHRGIKVFPTGRIEAK